MKIRNATHADINKIISISIDFWAETRYSEFDFDINKLYKFVGTMIEYENGIVLVAEQNNEIIGGLMAEVFTHFFGNSKAAMDLALFIDKDFRGSPAILKLINKYKETAKELGAEDVMIGISSNIKIKKAESLFKRLGFKQVGSLFNLESA